MHLKVISFNIRSCDDKDGHSIPERAPRLHAAIAPRNPDLIGLQEYRPAWEAHIEKYFGEEYEIFNKYRSTESPESAPILWKRGQFACLDKGYFWLSDTPEIESRGWDERYNCHRICEWVILEHKETGKRFTFMNTHYGFGDNGQIKSSELIAARCKQISALPTFLTGDFNMRPNAPGYAAICKYFTDVNAATRNDLSSTFHAYHPETRPDSHIDFCFVNDLVTPVDQKIIKDTFDGKYPSDHYGLEIDLRL